MKSDFPAPTCQRLALSAVILIAVTSACNNPPEVNPWVDDSIASETWSTPSRDGILKSNEPYYRKLDIPPTPAPRVSGDVPHYPLYWEDPFTDQGDNNQQFAWTWQDYLDMPYSTGRFLLNTMGWPVSVVQNPPFSRMVSDGQVQREIHPHDARPGESPDPAADRQDFNFPDTKPPQSEQASTTTP
jgi:hypothetical protein